ncbi:hypothetical protein AMK59_2368, partial [Oryctes borbonicus]
HNFIRGLDSVPGASCRLKVPGTEELQDVFLFGSTLWKSSKPTGTEVEIEDATSGVIHEGGMVLTGSDGVLVNVKRIKVNGRMKLASSLDQLSQQVQIEFTTDEKNMAESIRAIWESILNSDVEDDTDLFASGAGSMDVVRLVEEVKDLLKIELENEDVFMAPVFDEFCQAVVLRSRGANAGDVEIEYRAAEINANGMNIKVPIQLFIDGKFVDADDRKTTDIVNPTDETVICKAQAAGVTDVDKAVAAAKRAFETGEWSRISARERGQLLYK